MGVKYKIELKRGNETLTLDVKADHAAEALGKVAAGKHKLPQPHPKDATRMMVQPFIPNGEWIIERITRPGRSYPEMDGQQI